MKIILIGSIIFLVWSGVSTYLYVCQIKELCPGNEVVVKAEPQPEVTDIAVEPEVVEKIEPKVESPGSFTLYHLYNHQDFIQNERLTPYLDELKKYLNQKKETRISITGFADAIGPEEYNYELGLNRAKYVQGLLINSGISSDNIRIDSKGEKEPVASNNTKEGRAKNRRTEIKLN